MTFLVELRPAGANERFLRDSVAFHEVSPGLTRLTYLPRRAWWKGRSEVRRSAAREALGRQWPPRVAEGPAATRAIRHNLLGLTYNGVVASVINTNIAVEVVRSGNEQR